MQIGKNKDQGLYNKPSAAVHPGPLAAGTLPQYNTYCKMMHGAYNVKYTVDVSFVLTFILPILSEDGRPYLVKPKVCIYVGMNVSTKAQLCMSVHVHKRM